MSQQSTSTPAQTPSIGRTVLYVLGDEFGSSKGESRPATVVAMRHPEMPNLRVLLDGPNDRAGGFNQGSIVASDTLWCGSVPFGGPDQPGTWYWPPRV